MCLFLTTSFWKFGRFYFKIVGVEPQGIALDLKNLNCGVVDSTWESTTPPSQIFECPFQAQYLLIYFLT
jgi:hypothetical protein